MELSSEESIRAFVRTFEDPIRGPAPSWRAGCPAQPARRERRVRCQCGQCHQCLEDARWERIFAEKFADPNYYTRRVIRCSSPLISL